MAGDLDAIIFATGGALLLYILHLWRRNRRRRNQ